MTSHVKDKKEKDGLFNDNDNEQEEDPEDGIDGDDALADIEEEEQGNIDIDDEQIRVSTMSLQQDNTQNGGSDLKHIVSNSGSNRRNIQGIAGYNR